MSKASVAARVVLSFAIALLVFFLHLPETHDNLLFDDAADYMHAAQSPFLSTWLNTNSESPAAMIRLRKQNPEFRHRPWDFLYAAGDNAALRHFHSPVSFYAMHAVRPLADSDRSERLLVSGVSALTCGFLFFLLVEFTVPLVPAALLALFAGLQSNYIEVSIDPTPHAWYIFFAFGFLYFFARFLLSPGRRDLFLAAILLALAFATLEFTVELVASIPLALALLWISNRRLLPRWAAVRMPLLKACGIFLAASLLIWPGGWMRGGYLESYGVLSATVLLKNKSAFGERLSAGLIYDRVFAHHAVLLLLAALWIVGAAWALMRRRLSTPAIVFSSYTLFAFLLGVADHFRLATYIAEFALFLIVSAGLAANDILPLASAPSVRRPLLAAASLLLILGCVAEWHQRNDHVWASRDWLRATFAGVQQHVPAGQTVLVSNNREALSLYLPEYRFEPTLTENSAQPRSSLRTEDVRYCLFDSSVSLPQTAHVVAVYPGAPGQDGSPGHSEVLCEFR